MLRAVCTRAEDQGMTYTDKTDKSLGSYVFETNNILKLLTIVNPIQTLIWVQKALMKFQYMKSAFDRYINFMQYTSLFNEIVFQGNKRNKITYKIVIYIKNENVFHFFSIVNMDTILAKANVDILRDMNNIQANRSNI